MAFQDAENAIKAQVEAVWTRPLVPIYWLGLGTEVPFGPYAVIFIEGTREDIVAFGGGRGRNEFRTYGGVHGFFYVPKTGPIELARAMRDEFCNALRGKRFSGVSVLGVTPLGGNSSADKAKHICVEAMAEFEHRFSG